MARPGWMTALALVFALVAAPVFGQGGTSSATLSGVVTDKDGGLVPGATVVVTKLATGEKLPPQVTNASGAYSFPGLAAGKYKVAISLQGFKTAEIDATLTGGSTNSLNTKLEVGAVSEVVNVTAGTELVRTDTPTVTQTVNANFIQTLPRSDRNALNFLIFLPGVTTVGGAGGARNNTTIAGLPNNQFNITIDGITNSNLLQTSDGFFSLVVPRLDAVEEVALTTASAGADASGQGAIQVRFVTRSGTNKFEISVLRVHAARELQQQHVLQPAERAAGPEGDQPHVWRPHRRSDHPAGLRRPRPGVLLLQPGRSVRPDRDGARAHDHQPAGAERRLRLWHDDDQHGERDGAGGGQRPGVDL